MIDKPAVLQSLRGEVFLSGEVPRDRICYASIDAFVGVQTPGKVVFDNSSVHSTRTLLRKLRSMWGTATDFPRAVEKTLRTGQIFPRSFCKRAIKSHQRLKISNDTYRGGGTARTARDICTISQSRHFFLNGQVPARRTLRFHRKFLLCLQAPWYRTTLDLTQEKRRDPLGAATRSSTSLPCRRSWPSRGEESVALSSRTFL